jgi:hypothetical protein
MPTKTHDTKSCDCDACNAARKKLWTTVEQFVEKQRISCPETIWQSDRVIENGYDFIKNCSDITGYYQYPDED